MYKMYFDVQTQLTNALYPSSFCRIPKHYTHDIFERRWYTKLKIAIKFVKGLPHMCSCHQPNPERGLVTYTRWITTKPNCYLCHTIKYNIIIHFVSLNTQSTIEYSTYSLAIWTLCDRKLRQLAYTSHKSAHFTLILEVTKG